MTQKAKISTSEKWTYGYDHRNQMTKAEHITTGTAIDLRVTYKYDVWGNRVEKTVDPDGDTGSATLQTIKFVVDGWNPAKNGAIGTSGFDVLADLDGSGSLITRYMRGDKIDEILARVDVSGTHTGAYWYLADALGSIRAVVDNTGAVKDAITYNAFGGITAETDSSYRGRYAWTGREIEVETALQYNRRRYYDPAVGRWTSKDPLGFDAGDSNLYRYARNASTNATDPSGQILVAADDRTALTYQPYLTAMGLSVTVRRDAQSGRSVFFAPEPEVRNALLNPNLDGHDRDILQALLPDGPNKEVYQIFHQTPDVTNIDGYYSDHVRNARALLFNGVTGSEYRTYEWIRDNYDPVRLRAEFNRRHGGTPVLTPGYDPAVYPEWWIPQAQSRNREAATLAEAAHQVYGCSPKVEWMDLTALEHLAMPGGIGEKLTIAISGIALARGARTSPNPSQPNGSNSSVQGNPPPAPSTGRGAPTNLGPIGSRAQNQVTPGIREIEGHYINDRGISQPWRAHYDQFGRLIGRTDYNAGNRAAGIPDIHHHTYQWGPGMNPMATGNHLPEEFVP